MVDNANPSVDPANDGSMVGLFEEVLNKYIQKNVNVMLPAKVLAFDRETNRASVQPLVAMVNTNQELITRAQVASVPVFQISGGNCILNFNLKEGDLGWIKAADRDLSNFLQSYNEAGPNTYRQHSFEDSVFFPDSMTGYTINAEDEENAVFQTLDGSQRIAIWPDKIKITSDAEIVLDAPIVTITGDLETGTDTGGAGIARIRGSLLADGDVRGDADGNDYSLNTHVHINSGGAGDGGPPKP